MPSGPRAKCRERVLQRGTQGYSVAPTWRRLLRNVVLHCFGGENNFRRFMHEVFRDPKIQPGEAPAENPR
jgi:hypothetical protein